MKRSLYGERDHAFGQLILTLRTRMGLTQAHLAQRLGISRRAVSTWELGSNYPVTEHLKQLIVLAVELGAWAAGREAEEIRAFWRAAHQKVLLDERWLQELLGTRLALVAPQSDEQTNADEQTVAQPAVGPRVDWGNALDVSTFYGRERELAQLSRWVVEERCRVVSVLGMGGIGKSALAARVMQGLASHFEVVLWRSLRDVPECSALLDTCLQILAPQPPQDVPASLEGRLDLLLELLRDRRALLVLDNLEMLLEEGASTGRMRVGSKGYRQLLRRVAETAHQSCLLLTSREKPTELIPLEGRRSSVRALRLAGLDVAACEQLLAEKDVEDTAPERARLIEAYAGNPLALKIVAHTIVELFGGKIAPFLEQGEVVFGGVREVLDEQFDRLSAVEQSVLLWLAILREPVSLEQLLAVLATPRPPVQVLEALDGLRRRSLIERGQRLGSFTLHSVVLEYVTAHLVAEVGREIKQGRLDRLRQYGLCQAQAKEYVRQTQERLLLLPVLADLQSAYPRREEVEQRLLSLLDELRGQEDSAQGYGPANLAALLRLLRGHLSGLNLSRLSIRSACLQSVQMHDASLAGALIRDTSFAEAFSATWAVTISPDGRWWAAGSMQGKVSVWEENCQTLRLVWQAHTDLVVALAFSPDGRILASGGMDDNLKLWDMNTGALLWTGWQKCPQSLAFSPDGTLLASGGLDGAVRVFDPQSGRNLQTLQHRGNIFAVAFSPDGKLFASGCFDGQIRLWEKQETAPASYVEIHSIQTTWVTDLAFAPDGRTLASAHWDRMIQMWEVGSFHLLHRLSGLRSKYFAWSPDGHTLACGDEKTIWLWDVDQQRCRMALHGHTDEVYQLAFTPNSHYLLSSSADSTLRVWEVKAGQCLHVIPGYAISLYDLDWSPDGTQLVSGSTNGLVTIWNLSEKTPPRVFHGHTWVVHGVGWSPDSRFLASCSWDTTLRLWDLVSGACVHRFGDPYMGLLKLAWSPDGRLLAAGSFQRGMQVWDIATRSLRFVGQPLLTVFRQAAWSPDGTQLVGCGDDGNVYLWRGTDGTLLQQLSGHQGRVSSVAWSPDGKRLASCSSSGGTRGLFVWDVLMGERLQTFAQYPDVAYALAWSRNHRSYPGKDLLIAGCSDGTLCWWNVETGECVCVRAAHQGTIQSLKVSPDGRRLASCGNDGAIRIWDVESTEHLQTLRHDRPYERLNITDIRGLTEVQKDSLRALGAFEETSIGE